MFMFVFGSISGDIIIVSDFKAITITDKLF